MIAAMVALLLAGACGLNESGGCRESKRTDVPLDERPPDEHFDRTPREILEFVGGVREETLTWDLDLVAFEEAQTALTFEVVLREGGKATYVEFERDDKDDVACDPHLEIEVTMQLDTEDGGLDEEIDGILVDRGATRTPAVDTALARAAHAGTLKDSLEVDADEICYHAAFPDGLAGGQVEVRGDRREDDSVIEEIDRLAKWGTWLSRGGGQRSCGPGDLLRRLPLLAQPVSCGRSGPDP